MNKWLGCGLLILISGYLAAEDIELYVGDVSQRSGTKPQVLIIFDNSGSMSTTEEVKTPYDPDTVYPAIGGFSSLSDKFIYFTKGTGIDGTIPVPDSPSEARRFLDDINSCHTAKLRLDSVGYYTGHIREYSFQGNSGSWQEIPDNSGANIEVIDCWDDVNLLDPENAGILKKNSPLEALPHGYPVDGQGSKQNPVYYTANAADSQTQLGTGEVVTLYTDNYLRWSQSDSISTISRSRLDIAKDTVTDLIESAPSIDFGLQIFNHNHSGEYTRDGGRVVFGIQESTEAARQELIDIITLELDAETNTPLCETLYEARRYFGGLSVDFGDNDSNRGSRYKGNTPPRDTSVEDNKTYIAPYTGCSNQVYVILITDGQPTRDLAADTYVSGLPGIGAPFNVNGTNNYLAALAGWMNTNDINDDIDGNQHATLFTIGFGEDAINDAGELLLEAATLGGGQYYPAEDPSSLLSSLQSALIEIARENTSFTSPSIASNNFDRTETLDSVYYAMFLPDRGPRWQGNIKKLKVVNGVQVDRTNSSAINSEGSIEDSAKTFWTESASADGNEVKEGGVAEMLRTKSDRNILSDLGASGALVSLTKANAEAAYGGSAALAAKLDVAEDEVEAHLDWAMGEDVDDADNDGSTADIRFDVFADPLHSKPLVINYGGSSASQDVRIIIGTNAGVLHMFDDNGDSVDESWAFMPKEFFPNIKTLKNNYPTSAKVYGIDGSASSYILDNNGDGTISSASGDKAWIFVGLRRGGSSYYALDITIPDSPKLLWHIDSSTSGYSELGQSWSQPRVGYSALNVVSGTASPVIFFGGGYDIGKDSPGAGSNDSVGRAIYMADAKTGTLLWSLSPATASGNHTQVSSLTDSIPASIGTLDSDADGLIDRLYAGDSGGNVWRVDMPGNTPNSSDTPWTAFKLAQLGGSTTADDRRFFSEPSIVRTLISDTIETSVTDEHNETTTVVTRQERPYEAILIGSGDRSTPSATDTDDKFFMIRDETVFTQSFSDTSTPPTPDAIAITDLYDYTNNPFGQTLTSQERETLELAVSSKSGWFVDYSGSGEKSLSAATAVAGVAYFTSFTPASGSNSNTCELNAGAGVLYAVDLALGTTIYDWRQLSVGDRIPDTPTVIIPPDDSSEHNKLLFVGVGKGTDGGTITLCSSDDCDPGDPDEDDPDGISLKTMRTYLYVTESQ
ncbi:pilus assembly protein [Thalassomonas haliotis]|uniref:rRNA (Guanine-N1)-methyltransferase n=1 Tax=Thalassomonas haliotis TaxID=485448 RepID=A0ABY7VP19_9GAMM|nr:PilC/PilY family type IV pilus protein [Thalassomonas haliotis]WDE14172.1 rRNA (guanine-N1)-methyltransferase [Thalassomonas haliotis]